MFHGSPSSGFLHVTSHNDNTPKLTKLFKGLSQGQTLKGKILEVYNDGKALISIKRQKLTVKSTTPLVKGQEIQVRVKQLKPHPLFKILPFNSTKPSSSLKDSLV